MQDVSVTFQVSVVYIEF